MAKFVADQPVTFTTFDFTWFSTNFVRWNFAGEDYRELDGTTYRDVSYVTGDDTTQRELFFLGDQISKNANTLKPLAGRVTALAEAVGAGDADWFLTEIDVSIRTLVKVLSTARTTDDAALWAKLMSGDDTVTLSEGDDKFFGYAGNDSIEGGSGADTIVGGFGADEMTGGGGADVFVFDDRNSGLGLMRDTITDFTAGEDSIDLSAIDANTRIVGDQAFALSGTTATANGLWYLLLAESTVLYGDVNGDARADFAISLAGTIITGLDQL